MQEEDEEDEDEDILKRLLSHIVDRRVLNLQDEHENEARYVLNHIGRLPASIRQEIVEIWLRGSKIDAIPNSVPLLLPCLDLVSVNDNLLRRLPNTLTTLTGLQRLYIDGNPHLEALPSALTRLTQIQSWDRVRDQLPPHLQRFLYRNPRDVAQLIGEAAAFFEPLERNEEALRKNLVILMGVRGKSPWMKMLGRDIVQYLAQLIWREKRFSCRNPDAVWRAQREATLCQPFGWLSVCGLDWLEKGQAKEIDGHTFELTPEGGKDEVVHKSGGDFSEVLLVDSVVSLSDTRQVTVIKRDGDRIALRLRDANAPTRLHFRGCQWWAYDPQWCITAERVESAAGSPTMVVLDTVTGGQSELACSAVVRFFFPGQLGPALEVLLLGPEFWLIFTDKSSISSNNGQQTRQLFAEKSSFDSRRFFLNFNRAHFLPCSFIKHATCPIPPRQNRFDMAVNVGEKNAE